MSTRTRPAPRFLSVREAADRLSVSPQRVYEWIYAGRIKALRLPGRGKRPGVHRIPEDALQDFITNCEQKTA